MEQIKQNQFVLYQELNKANQAIAGINEKTAHIMNAAEQTAINSEITARCAQITAENTAFLADLAL